MKPQELLGKLQAVEELAVEEDSPLMLFYGVGNHGGGPTVAMLKAIEETRAERGSHDIAYGSPDRYFAEIRKGGKDLRVVADDLQRHACGCYSTMSDLKADNRKAENRLLGAEKMLVIAHKLLGLAWDRDQLTTAWRALLFNQFHDIIARSCIPEACVDARELYGESLSIAARAFNSAAQKISWSIDTTGGSRKAVSKNRDWILWSSNQEGAPLVVFNTLSWDVSAPVEIPKQVKGVTDWEGHPLAVQDIRASRTFGTDNFNSLFLADVPAMGYRTFRVSLDEPKPAAAPAHGLSADQGLLENDWLRLKIDPHTGWLRRLFDTTSGCDVLAGEGAVPIVVDDTEHDTWAHGFCEFRDEIGKFGGAKGQCTLRGVPSCWARIMEVRYDPSRRRPLRGRIERSAGIDECQTASGGPSPDSAASLPRT